MNEKSLAKNRDFVNWLIINRHDVIYGLEAGRERGYIFSVALPPFFLPRPRIYNKRMQCPG